MRVEIKPGLVEYKGELKSINYWDLDKQDTHIRLFDISRTGPTPVVRKDELRLVTEPHDLAIGLTEVSGTDGENYLSGSMDHHLLSTNVEDILGFIKGQWTTRGFTILYAINTKKGTIVEVFKKGKCGKQILLGFINKGYDQWCFSDSWAPKRFWLRGEVVPVCATYDLTTGAEVNEWMHALWGKTIPKGVKGSLRIYDPKRLHEE